MGVVCIRPVADVGHTECVYDCISVSPLDITALVHVVDLVWLCLFASALVEAHCCVSSWLCLLPLHMFFVWLCLRAIAWVEASLSLICLSLSLCLFFYPLSCVVVCGVCACVCVCVCVCLCVLTFPP